MQLENKDIAQIENYLTQQMSAQDREAFEQRLEADSVLQKEVAAYRSLFAGFEGLQEESRKGDMQQWEREWASATDNDADLIEWYLNGELSDEANSQVEERIKAELAFAKKVEQYRQLLEGFQAAQRNSFSENMKQWEKAKDTSAGKGPAKVRRLQPLLIRIAAAAVILLLIGVGVQQIMQSQYSNSALVADYYQNPGKDLRMGDSKETEAMNSKYEAIHQMLSEKEYEQAIPAIETFLVDIEQAEELDQLTKKTMQQNIEWNYALALIGAERGEKIILSALEKIIADSDHEYQKSAMELRSKLDSFWR